MSATQQPANLVEMVHERARSRGNALAYEFEGRQTSFIEFEIKTNRVANALIALGVKPGERIAYLGKNSDIYFELLMGAMKANVVMAPVNWRLAGPDVPGVGMLFFAGHQMRSAFGDSARRNEGDARVGKRTMIEGRNDRVGRGKLSHRRIEIDERDAFDVGVFEDLAESQAIAAPEHERLHRFAREHHRDVNEKL